MDVREYMSRRCICGAPRSEHAHFEEFERKKDGSLGRPSGSFQVLAVRRGSCTGFLDEIELELRGNPLENPLLAPLVKENLVRAAAEDDLRRRDGEKEVPSC